MKKSWMMAVAALCAAPGLVDAATVRPQETDAALVNPGMGLTQYHMAGRMWAYGSPIPPGDTLAWFPGVSTSSFFWYNTWNETVCCLLFRHGGVCGAWRRWL